MIYVIIGLLIIAAAAVIMMLLNRQVQRSAPGVVADQDAINSLMGQLEPEQAAVKTIPLRKQFSLAVGQTADVERGMKVALIAIHEPDIRPSKGYYDGHMPSVTVRVGVDAVQDPEWNGKKDWFEFLLAPSGMGEIGNYLVQYSHVDETGKAVLSVFPHKDVYK